MDIFSRWRFKIEDYSEVSDDDCWLWTKDLNSSEYASVNWRYEGKRISGAHVGSWMAYNEQLVPEGMEIHHICEVRHCVNPSHLLLTTKVENKQLEGGGSTEFCRWGHPRSEGNVYYSYSKDKKYRFASCRDCQVEKGQRYGKRAARGKYPH